MPAWAGSRRRRLWICRSAWTTQTRCPHTHSRRKSSSRKPLDLKDKGRRDHTLISAIPGPRSGVHFMARTIRKPGLGIFDAMNEVGLAVKHATGGSQQPWFSTSPIGGSFYFASAPSGTQPPSSTTAPSTTAPPRVTVVAPPVPTPPRIANTAPTAVPPRVPAAPPKVLTPAAPSPPAGAATNQAGALILPKAISPKYASEDPGQARLHTCVDQYNANKATNGNGGMLWVERGGGYWTACNQTLR